MSEAGVTPGQEGYRASGTYQITEAVYRDFLHAFSDTNPLHVDADFARARGFEDKVMHGAILNGFVSHFIGVRFPGAGAVLHSVNTQFKSPCHLGDEILAEGVVTHVAESVGVMTMDMTLTNLTRNRVAARVKLQVGMR